MVAGYWSTIHQKEASPMAQKINVLGIDIAKLVFHIVGMDDTGHVVLRKALSTYCVLSCSSGKKVYPSSGIRSFML
jgi:hypothetical protein